MASSAPTFPSTKDTINYVRLCRLLVDVGTRVLKETFDNIYPPRILHLELGKSTVLNLLQSLQKKKILNLVQWNHLYPSTSSQVSSKNFDITLLVLLLRNICGLTPPATGWDTLPSLSDISCQADIARVKYYRNTVYGHAAQASVDDVTFNYYWKEIRSSLVRLGGPAYEEAIDKLRTDPLDPETEEHYRKLLREGKTDEDNLAKKIDELSASIERRFAPTTENMTSCTLKSELPKESNILGRTKEIDQIVQALSGKRENTTAGVLVSGAPGVGKSTVAIQAGHRLKNEFDKTVKFCLLEGPGSGGSEVRNILNVCAEGYEQTNGNPRYVLRNWCRGLQDDLILILDNAEDALERSFMNLLQDMRTCSDRKVKFLITWRLSDINNPTTGLDFQQIKIGPLGKKESIEVLMNGACLTNDKPGAQVKLNKIAELCENNPQALRLAGPLLAEDSEYSFEELIKELQENATKPLRLDRVMAVAFERLDEPLKHALVGLSVFSLSFERSAAEALLGIACADHLTKLKQRCLVQRQGNRYLIHLLIRSYARQMGKGPKLKAIVGHCQQRFLEYFLSLILTYAKKYWEKSKCKDSLCLFSEERLNLESTLTEVGQRKMRYFKEFDDVVDACGLVAPYIEDCVPSKLYVCFLNGLLRFSEGQEKVTKQVEILWLLYDESRRHGGDREKSKDLIEQAIKLHQDNLSSFQQDSLSEICYLSHYGRYLSQDCKKRDEAQPLLKKAVLMFEEKERCCTSTFDMGRVLSQMGHNERMDKEEDEVRHKEALTCYQEALSFRQSHYGEHVVTALAHKDVADYYLFIEDFGKAEEHYKAAERIFEVLEMMKQKEAVPTYKNFGRCFEKSGKIREARLKLEMGRDVAEATIEGSDKWKVAINTYLALLLYKHYTDEVSKAVKMTQDVFQMAKELNLKSWHDKEELEEFYNRYRDLVNTD